MLYHPDHGLAGVVDDICRRAGFRPRGTVRTSQAEGAVRLAAVGVGVALVPDNIVSPGIDCAVLHFRPRLIRDVAVYARSDWSPTAAAFVDVLRSNPRARPAGAVLDRALRLSTMEPMRFAPLALAALLLAGCGGSSSHKATSTHDDARQGRPSPHRASPRRALERRAQAQSTSSS